MYDVIVIGGGPAGSTVATETAKKGSKVLVIEKEKFPRPHVGESLLPFNNEIFHQLGVYDELCKRFVRKPGVKFIASNGEVSKTYCFKNVLKDQEFRTFNVNRAQFDQVLLNNSAKHGAEVWEEHRVLKVENLDTDLPVKVKVKTPEGEKVTVEGKFLIDASGQDSFLGRTQKWKEPVPGLDRSAFATHWKNVTWDRELNEGTIQIFYTGGEKKGWVWLVPLGQNKVGIGVVLDNTYIQKQREKFAAQGIENWRMALYEQEIQETPHLCDLAKNGEQINTLQVVTNYSFTVSRKYGRNFALTGDAGAFLDPIFATGIYLGAKTSMLIAQSLNEHLSGERDELMNALEKRFEVVMTAYSLIHKFIDIFYDPDGFNLAGEGDKEKKRETAFSLMHYLLAGDFFDNANTYLNFLNVLSDPKKFAKYEALTKFTRGEHDNSSCLHEGLPLASEMELMME